MIVTANRCSWFSITKHKQLHTTVPYALFFYMAVLLHDKLYEK